MKRAVQYAKVSGDDHLKNSKNLNGQLEMCREHTVNKGWNVVAALVEDESSASGYTLELPELERISGMAERGAFDILVVRELDRLSRSIVKQMRIEEILGNSGVQIEYVIEDCPDTAEGQLLKNVRAVIAEYEREKILERINRDKRLAVKVGNVMTCGPGPYGNRIKEKDCKRSLMINH